MNLDGVSTTALIALAAFAIDRIVSAVLFVLINLHILSDPELQSGAAKIKTERTCKVVYFFVSLILVIAVVNSFSSVRILAAMGLRGDAPILDKILTGIVLLGGTERLGEWMKTDGSEGGASSAGTSVQVTGTLTLDEKRP